MEQSSVATLPLCLPIPWRFVTAGFSKVGNFSTIKSFAGDGTMEVNLEGKVIVPGLIDSHVHLISGGFQAVQENSHMHMQNHVHPSQGVHSLVSSDAKSEYQVPANGQSLEQVYVDAQTSQEPHYISSTTPSSSVNGQVVESGNGGNNYSENKFQDICLQFRDALKLDSHALHQKSEVCNEHITFGL